MRLRVEVEWQGEPWRKRVRIQKLAIIDAIFGILVAIIYIVKLAFPDLEPDFAGLTSSDRINNSLALVFLIAANLIQTAQAGWLAFVVSKNEGRDPTSCFEASKSWYDFTQFSYLFAIVKCIIGVSYIIQVAPVPWVLALVGVTLLEIVFKMYMLYNVYGFMKDLKQSLKYMPKFKFIPVRSSPSPSIGSEERYMYDRFINVDFNANAKLLA